MARRLKRPPAAGPSFQAALGLAKMARRPGRGDIAVLGLLREPYPGRAAPAEPQMDVVVYEQVSLEAEMRMQPGVRRELDSRRRGRGNAAAPTRARPTATRAAGTSPPVVLLSAPRSDLPTA